MRADRAKKNSREFARLSYDMICYRLFAHAFERKVKAAEQVLNYQWSKDIAYLDAAVPLLEESLEYYRKLVNQTKDTYLYANSMQTAQRRIPIGGDDGKNISWEEMLPHYEQELANFKANLALLHDKAEGKLVPETRDVTPAADAAVELSGSWKRVKLTEGAVLMENLPDNGVEALAPELRGLTAFVLNGDRQRNEGTELSFTCTEPVKLLVGYFKDDQKKYAKAPKLETDASANEYGQAEALLSNAIHLAHMPLADVHAYHFGAGSHTLMLPHGYTLVLGFTSSDIKARNAALEGADEAMDWLFY